MYIFVDKNKAGERVSQTEWHNVVLWRGLAEVAEKYLKKGASVYIEGKIKTRKWEDKDGNTRYNTEILADSMNMLSSKQSQEDSPSSVSESVTTDDKSDDLPF